MKRKRNVLFLCTHNSARSQMAEAFLRKHGEDRFSAYSAGLEPTEVDPMTSEVMREVSLDLEGQHAKSVKTYLGKLPVHYLIVVCDKANRDCPRTWPGLEVEERLFWLFDDPAAGEASREERLQRFRQVRDEIEQKVKSWLDSVGEYDEMSLRRELGIP